VFAHERRKGRLPLDHLLPRSRTGRIDVARHGQGAGAEMHGGERSRGQLIDHGAHAHDVLEVKVRRVVEVDVRLRGAVDDEFESARELRGGDGGDAAVIELRLRMLGVACAHPSHACEPTRSCRADQR